MYHFCFYFFLLSYYLLTYYIFFYFLNLLFVIYIGPYSVNGVPLRRVNQKYVIATSTKVGVDGVDVKSIDDAFFGRGKDEKKGDKTVSEARKSAQTKVDDALIKNIKKVDMMEAYLGAKFSLSNGDKPHLMQF